MIRRITSSLAHRLRKLSISVPRAWHLWVPVLVLVLLCLPRLTSLIPAPVDFADEIYQPQQTLKFVSSRGSAFDKYGPIPNYFLIPMYGVSLLYWKLTGDFTTPSGDWPYGFAHPVTQFGTLIFETRVIHLCLSAAMLVVVTRSLTRLAQGRFAGMIVALLVVVGNYNVVWHAPLARPDTAMMVFLGISLALVARIALVGPRREEAIWLGICSAAAVGSKENAAPVLVFACLGLVAWTLLTRREGVDRRESIRAALRCAAWAIAVGAAFYAITNIAPSPANWARRMKYWLWGDGLSGDVWGQSASLLTHVRYAGEALWNNLGPAGVIVTPLLVLVALVRKPAFTLLLLAPFVGCALTVLAIPYTPDRFVLPGALALAFPAAVGLGIAIRSKLRVPTLSVVALAAILNLWWCGITWHVNATTEQAMLERAASAEDPQKVKAYALMFDDSPNARRLSWLGHKVDGRAMQKWIDATTPRPDVVYANAGRMQMLDEARTMPGRAQYYRNLAKFEVSTWPGMAALGYAPPERFRVDLPAWLKPWSFMPLVDELRHRDLLIYRRR